MNKLLKHITYRRFSILLIFSLAIVVIIKAKYNECGDLYYYLVIGLTVYSVFITCQSIKKKIDVLINFLINITCSLFIHIVVLCCSNTCMNNILIFKIMIFPIFSSILVFVFQYLSYKKHIKNIELIGFYSFPLKNISILDIGFSIIYLLWFFLWIAIFKWL